MHTKISASIAGIIAAVATLWISCFNLIEITNRANGRYTFYSQRASLSDDEAMIYFGCWTLLFIFVCYLSIKSFFTEKYIRSIIYSVCCVAAILLSFYVDTLFYHQLV